MKDFSDTRWQRVGLVATAISVCAIAGSACSDDPTAASGDALGDADTAPVGRLSSQDFVYLGAFRLPAQPSGGSSFGYGGTGLAFRADGDIAGGADGFPGSMFIGGHPYQQFVAEVTIPAPVMPNGTDANDLPRATLIQPFADVTGGLGASMAGDFRLGGMAWLDHPASGGSKLHWSVWRWYNVGQENVLGHGWSSPSLQAPQPAGGWRLGEFHNQITAGYVFDVPENWAIHHLGGRLLISGQNNVPGNATSSWGPSMFAYAPWLEGSPPPSGSALDAIPLVYYPYEPSTGVRHFPQHNNADKWGAGAWVEGATAAAVIVAGRKSLGPERYGDGQAGDCNIDKGYHGEPYEPQMLFYDPADLAQSAAGEVEPWSVLPYETWSLGDLLLPTCEGYITGGAFDRQSRVLYLVQYGADTTAGPFDPLPVVHAFRVN